MDKECLLCKSYKAHYETKLEHPINSLGEVLGYCETYKKFKHPKASCKRFRP